MTAVSELLLEKDGSLVAVPGEATVLEATKVMNAHSIGAVLVTAADRLVGILSERDVLRRVVAQDRSPSAVRVCDVMTVEVHCCTPDTTVDEAREVMMRRRVRHLPVLNDDGVPVGVISIGDLNAHQVRHQESLIGNLHEYIYGRV